MDRSLIHTREQYSENGDHVGPRQVWRSVGSTHLPIKILQMASSNLFLKLRSKILHISKNSLP